MKKNKNKKILFLGLGAIIIVALILVLIFVSSDKENNTSQQGSVNLNNLEDIYAKISDFDRILEKPGITQEQKENAVKNTRTFLSLCEQSYINHNNELPEWNEEEKIQYANDRTAVYDISFEDAYEELNQLSKHPRYVDLESENLYYIGSHSIPNREIHFSFNYQVSCAGLSFGAPSNLSTFRDDENVDGISYIELGESSIYDDWDESVSKNDRRYIQFIGF